MLEDLKQKCMVFQDCASTRSKLTPGALYLSMFDLWHSCMMYKYHAKCFNLIKSFNLFLGLFAWLSIIAP